MRRISLPGPAGQLSCLWAERESPLLPVLLSHGINGSATQWTAVVERLTDRDVLAVDLRGHGASQPGDRYGAADYAADVSAVLSALNITRAHLVGSSFGGGVCVTLAAAEPDRVASLTVLGGALTVGGDADAAAAELRRLGAAAFLEELAGVSFGPGGTPAMMRDLVRTAASRDQEVIEAVLRAALTADVSAAAARVHVPARVLTGEHDRTCPPELGAALAAALRTEPEVLPGLGHLAHIEDPQRVAGLIAEHLRDVESGTAAERNH